MTGFKDLGSLKENLTGTENRAMLTNMIIPNSPQPLVSFIYPFYNNVLTRPLVADQWACFLQLGANKALRVSSPNCMEHLSYFHSLPLKYSVPLMVVSIALD
jgi:hypothetical protein